MRIPKPRKPLRIRKTYSNMLYLPKVTLSASQAASRPTSRPAKTRVTFRVNGDLAGALRQLPNQSAFVERTLREALGQVCPLCHGTGESPARTLVVSDLKQKPFERIDRSTAAQLRSLVRLGRQLLATELELLPAADECPSQHGLSFRLAREDQLLLSGIIPPGRSGLALDN